MTKTRVSEDQVFVPRFWCELSGAGAGRQWRGHVIDVTKRWREPVNDAEAAFDLVRLQLHAAMDDGSGKSRWAEARKRN